MFRVSPSQIAVSSSLRMGGPQFTQPQSTWLSWIREFHNKVWWIVKIWGVQKKYGSHRYSDKWTKMVYM